MSTLYGAFGAIDNIRIVFFCDGTFSARDLLNLCISGVLFELIIRIGAAFFLLPSQTKTKKCRRFFLARLLIDINEWKPLHSYFIAYRITACRAQWPRIERRGAENEFFINFCKNHVPFISISPINDLYDRSHTYVCDDQRQQRGKKAFLCDSFP